MHASPRRQSGFTLVEVLIVVVILGILAAIVVPQFTNASQLAAQVSFIADVRTYQKAAMVFINERGEFPEDSGSGFIPAGFEDYIDEGGYLDGTPIGGLWDFELDSFGITSGFGVHFMGGGHPGDAYMLEIDEQFDDGDLNTGGFRKIDADRYYFILHE